MARQALAAPAHDAVVVPGEAGLRQRPEGLHPRLRGVDLPLPRGRRAQGALVDPPDTVARELAAGTADKEIRPLVAENLELELERVRQDAAPGRAPEAVVHDLRPLDAAPPLRPAPRVVDRVPDRLSRRVEQPRGQKAVGGHGARPG